MHAFYAEDSKAKLWLTYHLLLDPAPLFTNVGLDVFGDFKVKLCKATRSRSAKKKVWVVLFTCLSSLAVHLELIGSLDTSTFTNALRHFLGIRGKGSLFKSDNGGR